MMWSRRPETAAGRRGQDIRDGGSKLYNNVESRGCFSEGRGNCRGLAQYANAVMVVAQRTFADTTVGFPR